MKNVLVINSSLNGETGNSHKLTEQFVQAYQKQSRGPVQVRDLAKDTLPHLSSEEMQAWMQQPAERDEQRQALAAVSDGIVEEVKAADIIVVGMPMYNFGVPSSFKAWIDRVARAGVTFRYTETGPVGLLENKKVIVLAARGGVYAGTEKDTQTRYLVDFFNFIGISDVEFIYAEGLAMGDETFENAWNSALLKINEKILELNRITAD